METRRWGAALTAALGLLLPALAAAGEGRWTSQGPNTDVVSALAVDPRQAGTVFAATYYSPDGQTSEGELFKSEDGGVAWRALVPTPRGTFVRSLAFDGQNRILYGLLSTGDLFQSSDGGSSWRIRHAFGTGPGTIVIDPRDPETIYLVGSACDPGESSCAAHVAAIWRQRPGSDWETLAIDGATSVRALAIDPTVSGRLYAGTDTGVWRSTDDGESWESVGRGVQDGCSPVSTVAVGRDGIVLVGYFRIYDGVAGCGGAFRSSDAGATWSPVSEILPLQVLSFAFDPADPRVVWASAGDVILYNHAIYRSVDGGSGWLPVNDGLVGYAVGLLAVESTGHRLYAATLAGVFDLELPDSVRSVEPPRGSRPNPRSVGPRP